MRWFTKYSKKWYDVQETDLAVQLPSESAVEDVKVPLISEPVLSLIESLKNREWSFSPVLGGYGSVDTMAKNKKNNLSFTFSMSSSCFGRERVLSYSCNSGWMTRDEREIVSKVAFEVMKAEWEEWSIVDNWKEREKFMILTKGKH